MSMTQLFVGRDLEQIRLQSFLERTLAGQGQVVFVAGEAGSGKTALAHAFAALSQTAPTSPIVAIGNCNAQSRLGDAYLPFREVLSLLTGVSDQSPAHGAFQTSNADRLRSILIRSAQIMVELGPELIGTFVPGATLLAKVGKVVVQKSGWLDDLEKLVKHEHDQATAPVLAIAQDRIFEQYANVLNALATLHPLLIIVDDLHWADSASISLLFHLSRRIEQNRILLVGTYRPEEIYLSHAEDRHPLEKVLAEIKRYSGDVCLNLGLVDAAERYAFVNQLVDSEPNRLDAGFRETLFRHTEGHPLFTIELLRTLQERGNLVKDDQGCWCAQPWLSWRDLPARVEGVIEERVGRLDARQREILQVASVEGETFTADVISQVQQLPQRQLLQDLTQNLQRNHCLVWEQGETRVGKRWLSIYQFTHALFRQFVYGELGRGERRLLHREVAQALEILHAEQPDQMVALLAWHYEQAGEDDRAVAYLIKAGRRALGQAAPLEARQCFDRALALLPPQAREERWQALLGRGEALAELGELEAWHSDVTALLELAQEWSDDDHLAEAHYRAANHACKAGDYRACRQAAETAAMAAQRARNPALEARALAMRAIAETRLGNNVAAVDSADEALLRAWDLGDDATLAAILPGVGLCYVESGDICRATQLQEEQSKVGQRLGNRYIEVGGLVNLGASYMALGMSDLARTTLALSLQISESIGARRARAYSLLNLGEVHWLMEQYSPAYRLLDQARSEMASMGDVFGQAWATIVLGHVLEGSGDVSKAIEAFTAGTTTMTELGLQPSAQEGMAGLARCALAQGRLDEGRRIVADLWAFLKQYGGDGLEFPMRVYLTCAESFQALGDAQTARAAIDTGYRELMERADKISIPAWRQSYLEALPCNRAITEKWHRAC